MTCARADRWLQLYLDGRLDLRGLARLEEHLDVCAVCRKDLLLLEIVCQGAMGADDGPEALELTHAIMRRIAELEARRAAAGYRRDFSPVWRDALLASALATLLTACFLVFQPALRATAGLTLIHTFLPLDRDLSAILAAWAAWVAWLVWVGVGLALAISLAGGEVRATWRRAITARLPHL